MKANNALVLLWKGDQLPDYLVKKVAEVLITNSVCIPEMLTIKVMDEDAVTNALLNKVSASNNVTVVKNENELAEAVKQAVIYIGKRFEASLNGTNGPIGNIALFAIELSNAVAIARRNTSFIGVGTADELLTAIEILSTTNAVVPTTLAKKYHFTQNVVDIIKKVYNSY
jgi:hypothetical protein